MDIFTKPIALIFIGFIKLYQIFVSPLLGASCRHRPTCSQYCVESITTHGLFWGLIYGVKRVFRCRPGGTSGFDPVPTRKK